MGIGALAAAGCPKGVGASLDNGGYAPLEDGVAFDSANAVGALDDIGG